MAADNVSQHESRRAAARAARCAALLLPAALWLLACFYLLGALGLWIDDWYYVQRVPETLAVEAWYLDRPIHFWRPLYKSIVPPLLTLFWQADAIPHALLALAHAGVAALLWRLLWTLGANRLAAAAAALLFLTTPVHFECVFWISALPTTLATALGLATLLLTAHWARGRIPRWRILLLAPAYFAIAALNEQPAALAAALPVVALAARRPRIVGADPPADAGPARRPPSLPIALIAPASMAAIAAVAYTTGHVLNTTGTPALGYDTAIVPPSDWPHQVAHITAWAAEWHTLDDVARGAWQTATAALAATPARAIAIGAAILLGAAFWIPMQTRRGGDRASTPGAHPRHGWLLVLGAVITIAPWIPVGAFNYWLNPRLCYVPALGLATLIATAGSIGAAVIAARVPRLAPVANAVGATALLGGCLVFAIVSLGIQKSFQSRARRDLAEMAQLRQLWPDPPPGAVFVPICIDPPPHRPGGSRLDDMMWPAIATWWSARWIVRLSYRRSDIDAAHTTWSATAILDADEHSAALRGAGRPTWKLIIPFQIDPEGTVTPVTRIRIFRPSARDSPGPPLEIEPPLAREAARAAGIPGATFDLQAK
jgi:hypothetical protein